MIQKAAPASGERSTKLKLNILAERTSDFLQKIECWIVVAALETVDIALLRIGAFGEVGLRHILLDARSDHSLLRLNTAVLESRFSSLKEAAKSSAA